MTTLAEYEKLYAHTGGRPHYTKAETPIPDVWNFARGKADPPDWCAPSPTIRTLHLMREPDFKWQTCMADTLFAEMLIRSGECRMSDGHKDLLRASAKAIAKWIIDIYVKACLEVAITVIKPYAELDEITDYIIDFVMTDKITRHYHDSLLRSFALQTLSDPECTCNNPLITTEKLESYEILDVFAIAIKDSLANKRPTPKEQFNRALDMIAVYTRPKDRLPYRELERQLTISRRIIYALEAGQMDT